MKNLALILLALLAGAGCSSARKWSGAGQGVERLQALMTGTFNSAEQAAMFPSGKG